MGTNVILSIEPPQGTKVEKVLGTYESQLTSWGAQINLWYVLLFQILISNDF